MCYLLNRLTMVLPWMLLFLGTIYFTSFGEGFSACVYTFVHMCIIWTRIVLVYISLSMRVHLMWLNWVCILWECLHKGSMRGFQYIEYCGCSTSLLPDVNVVQGCVSNCVYVKSNLIKWRRTYPTPYQRPSRWSTVFLGSRIRAHEHLIMRLTL